MSGLSATVTVTVKFNATITHNSLVDDTMYDAKVDHHWGPTTTSTQTNEYAIGGENSIEQTYVYGVSDGEVDAGYSVYFGEGAGFLCSGKIYSQYFTINTNTCLVGDSSELEVTTQDDPQSSPTFDPLSLPTLQPSTSQGPSSEPTESRGPSFQPTLQPSSSKTPSSSPTLSPSLSQEPSSQPTPKCICETPQPSTKPTKVPSVSPSLKPSTSPSISTAEPSKSEGPSASSQPTQDILGRQLEGTTEDVHNIQVCEKHEIKFLSYLCDIMNTHVILFVFVSLYSHT